MEDKVSPWRTGDTTPLVTSWPRRGETEGATWSGVDLWQFAKFSIVGGGATLIHIAAFVLLIEIFEFSPLLANLAAFVVAFSASFLGNFVWTFGRYAAAWAPALGRFLLISSLGLAINSLIVYVVTEVAAAPYVYAAVLMGSIVPGVTFVLSRRWGFTAGF